MPLLPSLFEVAIEEPDGFFPLLQMMEWVRGQGCLSLAVEKNSSTAEGTS